MNVIVGQIKTATPAADVIALPADLMNTLYLDGGIVRGSYTPLGRDELGLAVKKGAPKPDISTVDKLAAVLKSAQAVEVNDPKAGTMQGVIIDGILKRPEFAGVHVVPVGQGRRRRRAGARRRRHGDPAGAGNPQQAADRSGGAAAGRAGRAYGRHSGGVVALDRSEERAGFHQIPDQPGSGGVAAKGLKPF